MIPTHPSWEIKDSSKLNAMKRCQRYFFLRYMCGWKRVGGEFADLNLVFGEAWHRAKESILQDKDGQLMYRVGNAMLRFNEYFRQHFEASSDMETYPKNPGNAQEALLTYMKERRNYTVLELNGKPATEVYGTVPIDDTGRRMHFRIDAIIRMPDNSIAYIDHKTTGSEDTKYQKLYAISGQMGTYDHALSCIFGRNEKIFGGMVELTIFRKSSGKGNAHLTIPLRFAVSTKQQWLWNITHWFIEVEKETERLLKCTEDEPVLTAFPQNECGCPAYFRMCEYYDICMSIPNPLRCEGPPVGFEIDFWDPSKTAKERGKEIMEVA